MSERRSEQVAARAARGLAVAALTVPAMVIAHLVAAGTIPSPSRLVAVAALVAVVSALVRPGGAGRRDVGSVAVICLAQLAGHAVFSMATAGGSGCLPVMGRGAEVGLRLALLQPDPACPPGTLGLTEAAATTTSMLLAALLVVIAHLISGALGQLLVVSAGRAWRVTWQLLRAACCSVVVALGLGALLAGLVVGPRAQRPRSPRPADYGTPELRTWWSALVGRRRGPPRLVVA